MARVISLGKDGACFAGDDYLAKDLGCTSQYVRKMRKQLEGQGYVVRTGYGSGRRLSVNLTPEEATTGTSNARNKQLQEQATVGATKSNYGSNWKQPQAQLEATTVAHTIEYSKEKNKEPSKEGDEPKKEARPKSVEVVVAAFLEAGSTEEEANKYFDYYTANGWKVGRSAMKDWKAAARNWLRNGKKYEQQNNWRDRSKRELDPAKALEWANRKR